MMREETEFLGIGRMIQELVEFRREWRETHPEPAPIPRRYIWSNNRTFTRGTKKAYMEAMREGKAK